MLLFWPTKKNNSTFAPVPPKFSGDLGLLGQGMDLIKRSEGALNKYGIDTSGLISAMSGAVGANQIGGQSRGRPSLSTSSNSPSSIRARGTYFGNAVNQQKQFNLDTYAKAAPGVLFGESDSRFETPAMRVARQQLGDFSGPAGKLPVFGQGNPAFGETGVGNVFAEGDPRLTQSAPPVSPGMSMMGEYQMPSGLNY